MDNFYVKPEQKQRRLAWRFTDILGMLGIGTLLLVAGAGLLAVMFDLDTATGEMPAPTLAQGFGLIILEAIGFVGAIGVVGYLRRIDWAEAAYLRPMSLQWWGRSFVIGILCIPLVNLVAVATQTLLGQELEQNPQLELVIPEGFSWVGLIGMALLLGLLIPFVEELFFRGVLFTWLRRHWTFLPAALLTSLLFGVVHVFSFLIFSTAVLGFVSAWAMEKSGSLWAAVVIHALNNIVNVVLAYWLLS